MKKIISFMLSIIMVISIIPKMDVSVSAMGYNPSVVVNLALSKVGTNYMNGYCLAFVRQMFESAYGFSSTSCCAYKYGSRFIDSTSRTNIPLGADVFFGGSSKTCSTCGNKCGHIGIYVGDDYVVHGWSGKIEKFKIDRIISAGYPYRGWGWHNDIALGDVSTNPDDYSVPTRDIYYTSPIMRGDDVGWIQAVLYQCGYNINIDCSFGPASKAVVEQFQRDNGLTVDGSVGPATREKLKQKWEEKKKSNITLSSIAVATYPTKTLYYIGESLDLTGLTLTATYSDGTKKTVTEDYSVSGFDSSSAGTKTITVSFDGKTTTFTVTVKEPEPKTYIIVYNANGGSGTMANTVMTVGTAKSLTPNAFTRAGYSFLGWSKDKNASTATYSDGQSVKDLAQSGTVTLYAIWKANGYTIAFNANGGTGTMSNMSMTYDTAKNLTANTFTRTGYTFLGWSKDKGATTATYTDKQSVKNLASSGTVTLYAVWKKNTSSNEYNGVLRVDDAAAAIGQTVKIPVYIDNTKLSALSYIVEFDPKVLESSGGGASVFQYEEWNTDEVSKGRITISCMDMDKAFSGKITELSFKVIGTNACSTKIKVTVTAAGDENLNEVSVKGSEAVITVSSVILGDLNGNGKVDVMDALAALKASAGKITLTDAQTAAADINKNGRVDVLDALMILKASAGKVTL